MSDESTSETFSSAGALSSGSVSTGSLGPLLNGPMGSPAMGPQGWLEPEPRNSDLMDRMERLQGMVECLLKDAEAEALLREVGQSTVVSVDPEMVTVTFPVEIWIKMVELGLTRTGPTE